MITGTEHCCYHFDSQKTLHDLRNFVVVSKDDPTADYHRAFAFSLTRWIVSHPFFSFIYRLFIYRERVEQLCFESSRIGRHGCAGLWQAGQRDSPSP